MAENTTSGDSGGASRWGGRRFVLLTALIATLAAVGGAALLVNIFERKQEARNPFYRVVELTDETEDPAVWGKNFPLQYDDYKRTVDQVRTRYGGSEALPRTPTNSDPRSVVSQSKLEEDPRLKIMWAVTHSPKISERSEAMPSCSKTRLTPSARTSRNNRAHACIATRRFTCRTNAWVAAT